MYDQECRQVLQNGASRSQTLKMKNMTKRQNNAGIIPTHDECPNDARPNRVLDPSKNPKSQWHKYSTGQTTEKDATRS